MSSVGKSVWTTAFQTSPIIFSGGVSKFMPGQMLPLIAITEALNTPLGLLGGRAGRQDLDNFFAAFAPIAGGTLIEQDIARYPFANQVVAANAVIGQPLHINMLMLCPARSPAGYFAKLAIISALQAAIVLHNNNGGTYHVATPSYIYTDCIFRKMTDVSSGHSKQPQSAWMLEFEKPLITFSSAGPGGTVASQSSMLQLLTGLGFVNGGGLSWGGAAASVPIPSLAGPVATSALQGATQGASSVITSSPLPPPV